MVILVFIYANKGNQTILQTILENHNIKSKNIYIGSDNKNKHFVHLTNQHLDLVKIIMSE